MESDYRNGSFVADPPVGEADVVGYGCEASSRLDDGAEGYGAGFHASLDVALTGGDRRDRMSSNRRPRGQWSRKHKITNYFWESTLLEECSR